MKKWKDCETLLILEIEDLDCLMWFEFSVYEECE